jgi:glycosyltransferase involved in cell wall biosynthesis
MKLKRIALVVDMENWAFHIEAKILQQSLEKQFKIDIFVAHSYDDDLFKILEDVKDYDMIHFFWRKILLDFESDEFKNKVIGNGYDYNEYLKVCDKISTGIYDHLFVDDVDTYENIFTKYSKMYYTCSEKLYNIYKDISIYPKPWGVIHDTYDNKLYNGGDKNRFPFNRKELVIGWIGNSNWNIKYKYFKGFHTILNPVIDELVNEGYKIRKHYADKNIKFRTNEEMPAYYQEIDVCIITSMEEGTPRPVIEAMASGVPLITTDVGIVNESYGPLQKKFILGVRDNNDEEIKSRLKSKIIELYNNRNLIKELSSENYKYSINNSIEKLKGKYINYFNDFLEG